MPFITDLVTSDDEVSGNKSVLKEPLKYQVKDVPTEFALVVPANVVTDYASIPRAFQLFIPKLGRHRKAAVLHDYLYSKNNKYSFLTRKDCDCLFYMAMKESDVPRWKYFSMYRAVRLGGWSSFRKKEMEVRSV